MIRNLKAMSHDATCLMRIGFMKQFHRVTGLKHVARGFLKSRATGFTIEHCCSILANFSQSANLIPNYSSSMGKNQLLYLASTW